jgi:hypothetical protein
MVAPAPRLIAGPWLESKERKKQFIEVLFLQTTEDIRMRGHAHHSSSFLFSAKRIITIGMP